jgi:hypothetical protein
MGASNPVRTWDTQASRAHQLLSSMPPVPAYILSKLHAKVNIVKARD